MFPLMITYTSMGCHTESGLPKMESEPAKTLTTKRELLSSGTTCYIRNTSLFAASVWPPILSRGFFITDPYRIILFRITSTITYPFIPFRILPDTKSLRITSESPTRINVNGQKLRITSEPLSVVYYSLNPYNLYDFDRSYWRITSTRMWNYPGF